MASKNISTKRKKKNWYGLYAPESLNKAFLGESHVYNTDDLIGKTISLNLSMFTGDMKKQNIIASFRVKNIEENKGITELIGYKLSLSYLKRLVRRRRDKVDDSFLAKSKDDKIVRIKTVVMTNSRTYESANSAIRLSLRAKIRKTLKEMAFDEFVNGLINIRLQKEWKNSLSKIYPIKFLEVRHASLEETKKKYREEEDKDLTEIVAEEENIDLDEEETTNETDDEDNNVEDIEDESGDESEDQEKSSKSDDTKKEDSKEN